MPAVIAATLAFLVSMAFTLLAISNPGLANDLAAPVAIIAVVLMAIVARRSQP